MIELLVTGYVAALLLQEIGLFFFQVSDEKECEL